MLIINHHKWTIFYTSSLYYKTMFNFQENIVLAANMEVVVSANVLGILGIKFMIQSVLLYQSKEKTF